MKIFTLFLLIGAAFISFFYCSMNIADAYGFSLDGYVYDLSDTNSSYINTEAAVVEMFLLK